MHAECSAVVGFPDPGGTSTSCRRAIVAIVLLVWLVLAVAGDARADTVHLTNGDVVTGTILELDDDEIVFDAALLDEVRIEIEDIAYLETSRPVSIQYGDGREVTGYVVREHGQMVLRPERPEAAADEPGVDTEANGAATDAPVVTLGELFKLEPVETYYRYEGELDVGINVASGNTDQSSFNVSGMIAPSFGKNTVRLSGQLNRTVSDGDTTASNWRIDGSYEREFTRRWRAVALNRYENDKFQDLDLRVTAAAGPGYTLLFAQPSLDVFLAPAYVHETFDGGEKRDFAALLWGLNFAYDVPRPDLNFYHTHSISVGVTESQTVALTTTGFKWEIIGDLDLKLEYQVDWNSKPAAGADEFDQRYLVKISYDFEGDENDWWR